ncbi:MAG: hypothetical protein H0V28_10950, partial [Rubrobacteraceae bacterium]|nr:hypothetical protein [Rubrobacteraceae bacterium]
RHRYRTKAAWISYATIQVVWVLCLILTPVTVNLHPSRLWAVPFCCVTVASGLHTVFFRYEYNAVLRRAIRLLPHARYSPRPVRHPLPERTEILPALGGGLRHTRRGLQHPGLGGTTF